MPDNATLVMAFFAGLIMGVFFPAIWFFGSMMLRTALIVVAFYYVAQRHWSNLLACLAGFLLGRFFIVRRLSGDPAEKQAPEETEADVAHQSR
jgi:F1F0 ATPase subunit 2